MSSGAWGGEQHKLCHEFFQGVRLGASGVCQPSSSGSGKVGVGGIVLLSGSMGFSVLLFKRKAPPTPILPPEAIPGAIS